MSRSQKWKDEWAFFLDGDGRRKYAELCPICYAVIYDVRRFCIIFIQFSPIVCLTCFVSLCI